MLEEQSGDRHNGETPPRSESDLGHALAHELGHLLLRGKGTSGEGIMREHWDYKQWMEACARTLLLQPEHIKAIHRYTTKDSTSSVFVQVVGSLLDRWQRFIVCVETQARQILMQSRSLGRDCVIRL